MKKVAISLGDLNGIGIEIALKAHDSIKELVEPIYCIDQAMLTQAANLLGLNIPDDFNATQKEKSDTSGQLVQGSARKHFEPPS